MIKTEQEQNRLSYVTCCSVITFCLSMPMVHVLPEAYCILKSI